MDTIRDISNQRTDLRSLQEDHGDAEAAHGAEEESEVHGLLSAVLSGQYLLRVRFYLCFSIPIFYKLL